MRDVESHLVRCERVHVLQQRLSHFRAAFEDARQLSGGQLQQDAVRLRLGPLAAFHEAFPHLGILPHLQGESEGDVCENGCYRNGKYFGLGGRG